MPRTARMAAHFPSARTSAGFCEESPALTGGAFLWNLSRAGCVGRHRNCRHPRIRQRFPQDEPPHFPKCGGFLVAAACARWRVVRENVMDGGYPRKRSRYTGDNFVARREIAHILPTDEVERAQKAPDWAPAGRGPV